MKFKKFTQSALIITLSILVAAVLVGGSFALGYSLGVKNPERVVVKGITNIGDSDSSADFGIFWQAWKKIQDNYFFVGSSTLKDQDVVYGAINGMVEKLGDPNTIFLPPVESKKFNEDVTGSFGGIGAEIGTKDDQLVVIAPLKDSPSEKAGLKAGDKIVKINDTVTVGLNVNDAVSLIRGPLGTKVILTIVRDSQDPKDYAITRQEIKVPTLESSVKDLEGNKILYLKLFAFNQNATDDFRKAVIEATASNDIKGVVLDMRNNPGGFLDVAISLAGWFLKQGDVVTIKDSRIEPEEIFRAAGNEVLLKVPVVVLINQGSASASEILAGALRDDRRIQLIGEKSFGKGTVQQLYPLSDGSQLKITNAHWLTPKRQFINKNGLNPDIKVTLTDKDVAAKKDPQLDKALEVLKKQLQ